MASIFEAGQQDPVSDDMDMDVTGAAATGTTEVDAVRVEVEQTRCQIGGTLDAIREKLDPPTLMEQAKATVLDTADQLADKARGTVQDITGQAKHAVHDATIGRAQEAVGGMVHSAQHTGETIMDTVRENPIPMALIGLGIGMLYMNSRRHAPRHHWSRDYNYTLPYQDRMSGTYAQGYQPGYQPGYQQGYQPGYAMGYGQTAAPSSGTEGYVGGTTGQTGQTGNPVAERIGDLKDRAGDMAGQVQGRVSDMAGQVQDRVGDVAGRVQERVSNVAGTVQERAGQLAGTVQDRAAWAQDSLQRNMQENPLAVGVVALGIGALLGLMLPATEPENRYMGETRDRLVEQGQQVAQQVAQKVTTVAQEGLSAAKEAVQTESREQGLAA